MSPWGGTQNFGDGGGTGLHGGGTTPGWGRVPPHPPPYLTTLYIYSHSASAYVSSQTMTGIVSTQAELVVRYAKKYSTPWTSGGSVFRDQTKERKSESQ